MPKFSQAEAPAPPAGGIRQRLPPTAPLTTSIYPTGGGCGPAFLENADSSAATNCDRSYVLGSGFDAFFSKYSDLPLMLLQDAHDPNDAAWDHEDFVTMTIPSGRSGGVAHVFLLVPTGSNGGHSHTDDGQKRGPKRGWAGDTGEGYAEHNGTGPPACCV